MIWVALDLSLIKGPRSEHSAEIPITCHGIPLAMSLVEMFEQELISGTYALYPYLTPLGHAHVMDIFRPFDDQHPALQPLFHHRFVEDDGLGDGDDEGGGVVLVSAELVEGVDGVGVDLVG